MTILGVVAAWDTGFVLAESRINEFKKSVKNASVQEAERKRKGRK
jgi:hypothetical protein